MVAGFPLTNANYEHCDFANRKVWPNTQAGSGPRSHMQALLDLPSPGNSLTSLQLSRDSIESHMHS